MPHPARLLALSLILPAALARAEPAPCTGEGDPFLAVPGFGIAAALPDAVAQGRLRREPGALVLNGDRGPIRLEDSAACATPPDSDEQAWCTRHRLVAAFDDPAAYLVERGHYEHVDFLWISRATGQAEAIADLPRIAPGGRWLLSVSASDWMRLNGIELLELREGGVQRVFQHVPRGAPETYSFFAFWRWAGPEEAVLCAWRQDGLDISAPEPVRLARGPLGWRLEPLP